MSQTPTDTETEREARTDFDTGSMKFVSGLVSLVGLWIGVSPFVYDTTEMGLWNNVVVGLAVFLVAGYNFYRMQRGFFASVGSASLVALLGLWTIVAPFVMAFESDILFWSNVAAGAVIALLAAYNAYANREAQAAPAGARV